MMTLLCALGFMLSTSCTTSHTTHVPSYLLTSSGVFSNFGLGFPRSMTLSAPLSLVTGVSTGNDNRGRLINSIGSLPHGFAGLNECATMATFVDHWQLGTYMSSLNSHPKTSSTTSSQAQIRGRVSLLSKITASYSASAPRTHLQATCGFFPS
jgi:hypothetical protein